MQGSREEEEEDMCVCVSCGGKTGAQSVRRLVELQARVMMQSLPFCLFRQEDLFLLSVAKVTGIRVSVPLLTLAFTD